MAKMAVDVRKNRVTTQAPLPSESETADFNSCVQSTYYKTLSYVFLLSYREKIRRFASNPTQLELPRIVI